MITTSNIDSTIISDGQRDIKVKQFGAKTADECAPFGDDGNPLKGMVAIYADTSESGDSVIIGYINENQIAAPGEKRFYSLKPDGSLSISVWLKNNGSMEIGGNTDNMVRYAKLNAGLQAAMTKLNAEYTKIQEAITALGGAYVKADVALNISDSKIIEIKTI